MAGAIFLIDCTRIVNASEAKKTAIICTSQQQTSREFTHTLQQPDNWTEEYRIYEPRRRKFHSRDLNFFGGTTKSAMLSESSSPSDANLVTVGYERAIPTVMSFGLHWHPEIGQSFPLLASPLNHPLKWTAKVSRKKSETFDLKWSFNQL